MKIITFQFTVDSKTFKEKFIDEETFVKQVEFEFSAANAKVLSIIDDEDCVIMNKAGIDK